MRKWLFDHKDYTVSYLKLITDEMMIDYDFTNEKRSRLFNFTHFTFELNNF